MRLLRLLGPEMKVVMSKGVLDVLVVADPSAGTERGIVWSQNKITTECAALGTTYSESMWADSWNYFERQWLVRFPPQFWNVCGMK